MRDQWRAARRFRVVSILAIWLLGMASAGQAAANDDGAATRARFEELIRARVDFYNAAFPNIHFVHLRGGLGWALDMQFLPVLLGKGAVSLDYEHPAALRGDLLQASMRRLEVMLQGNHASASLFRRGDQGLARRANVCIITLNPDSLPTNDLDVTRDMLDLPRKVVEQIHPARHLDMEDHVAFAIDHEAFHCLDSLYNGPIPRSHRPYASNYSAFRNENGADAFAVAMNIHRHGYLSRYARNIMHVRALALVNDPDHCTWSIIQHVLALNPETLAAASVQRLFEVAGDIRDMLIPDYERYVEYRIAAYEVRARIDFRTSASSTPARDVDADDTTHRAKRLISQTEFWFAQLFRDDPLSALKTRTAAYW